MPIDTFSSEAFTDLFGGAETQTAPLEQNGGFSRELNDNSIFQPSPPIEEKKEEVVENKEPEVKQEDLPDTDLFVHEEDIKKQGRKPKYNFSDATGYFEDRIKNKKFVPIEVENDKGEITQFIPKSPEDYDEFIDFQLNHRFQEREKEVEENWYKSKSPAWQFVAQAAEKSTHPSELLPFIQGVQQIDNLSDIDETSIEGAEKVYRTWLTSRGEPSDTIEEQIELAKASDKLISMAGKYKPALIQQESQKLAQLDAEKTRQREQYYQIVTDNERKAIEAIESPIFGTQKLKAEEKALVYDMIAQPKADIGGYGIYAFIDKLYETKDFNTLRDIALLAGKRDSFLGYHGVKKADEVASGLQRTLRVANTQRVNSSGEEEQPIAVNKKPTQAQPANNYGFSRR